jgi:hydroxylamine oxidation protein HaoB
LALLIWAGWEAFLPAPAPYHYETVAEGPLADFPDLDLDGPKDLSVRRVELRDLETSGTRAVAHIGLPDGGGAPVLLEWRNRGAEPVLALGVRTRDLNDLAQAVAKNIPPEATVLAWWDTSRQLALLSGNRVLFNDNLGRPLFVPDAWAARREAIVALEKQYWSATTNGAPGFERFLDALVAAPETGAAQLRELAGGGPAYVVVHLSDAYRLAALRHERFAIGYRDFAGGGEIHGEVRVVKEWLAENGYDSYAVERRDLTVARVYFLADVASENTLLAALLPFTSSNPMTLEALSLVANYGGYWVFELPAAKP